MEFKYRADASAFRPQPVVPRSSGLVFFPDQAWRVDFPETRSLRPYLNSEFDTMRDPYLIRETVEREIEKQKIREEIIASEVARRQMLEDEVRREMMLERQMVQRPTAHGLPLQGKSAMWFGFNRGHPALHRLENRIMEDHMAYVGRNAVDVSPLPLMQSPEATLSVITSELNKDRLIKLPRPDPNLSRAKRKSSTSPPTDAGELSTFSQKKKTKEEWTCELCQVSATSEKALKEHLQGKKHKIREASVVQKIGKEGNTELQVSQELKDTRQLRLNMEQKLENTKGLRKNKNFRFWCEMCQIGAFCETVMDSHKMGKKHIARLQELGQADEAGCAAMSRASATSNTEQNITTAYAAEDFEKNSGEPKEATET